MSGFFYGSDVVSIVTNKKENVLIGGVVLPFKVSQNKPVMKYKSESLEPPGRNIRTMREALDWSLRKLGDECKPPLEHTTIRRVELNKGYTQDTLERIAIALKTTVPALFLPAELMDYNNLQPEAQNRVASTVQDAAIAERYKTKKTG